MLTLALVTLAREVRKITTQQDNETDGKPDYIGIGDPSKLIVQKTESLLTLTKQMSLPQLKLLDIYLGRINSFEPEHRWMRLERQDIERALGISKLNLRALRETVRGFNQPIEMPDPNHPENMMMVWPFDLARIWKDERGIWQVDLRASEAAMDYIFHPDRIGYIKYRLHNVVKLQSKYSYFMYLYIESNRNLHKSWTISIEELKTILMCQEEYREYKHFNAKILKKVQADINNHTTTRYEYEPLRHGRWIVQLRFTLDENEELRPHVTPVQTNTPKQIPATATDMNDDDSYDSDDYDYDYDDEDSLTSFLISALCPSRGSACEFSPAQIREIRHMLMMVPDDKLPDDSSCISFEDDARRADFAESCYLKMISKDEELKRTGKSIKNRYRYFLSMLRKQGGLN